MIRSLDNIKIQLSNEEFLFSRHAFIRTIERNISVVEIVQASDSIEIIEQYLEDKYSPSCLLLGFTNDRRPLHIQITLDSSDIMKIVTIYEPSIDNWDNEFKKRR